MTHIWLSPPANGLQLQDRCILFNSWWIVHGHDRDLLTTGIRFSLTFLQRWPYNFWPTFTSFLSLFPRNRWSYINSVGTFVLTEQKPTSIIVLSIVIKIGNRAVRWHQFHWFSYYTNHWTKITFLRSSKRFKIKLITKRIFFLRHIQRFNAKVN